MSSLGEKGQWVHLDSVADVVAHVKCNRTDIFHTQVTRAANKGATNKGWQFSFEDEIPHPPLVAIAPLRALHQRRCPPSSALSLLSPHVPAVAGISSLARIVITRLMPCTHSAVIAYNVYAVCAINHLALTCGHAKHAGIWRIPHVQCMSPSMWR